MLVETRAGWYCDFRSASWVTCLHHMQSTRHPPALLPCHSPLPAMNLTLLHTIQSLCPRLSASKLPVWAHFDNACLLMTHLRYQGSRIKTLHDSGICTKMMAYWHIFTFIASCKVIAHIGLTSGGLRPYGCNIRYIDFLCSASSQGNFVTYFERLRWTLCSCIHKCTWSRQTNLPEYVHCRQRQCCP